MFFGKVAQLVEVDALVLFANAVRNHVVVLAGKIDRASMGQVTAVIKVHRQDRVAQLEDRLIDCGIRARPRVRLNVCMIRTKELLGAFDREGLDFVNHFATAVVTTTGISFGVLVGER